MQYKAKQSKQRKTKKAKGVGVARICCDEGQN